MDTQGLSQICAGLGERIENDDDVLIGYTPSGYCLDNLKDLQRFLRRDDPVSRDVFRQICKWNIVGKDIVPIIEYNQNDRALVINAVKILVFLTMPIDSTTEDVAQQMEYLWDLKAAVTRNVTVAVIVSLLEDPLEHLESNSFTEDDWKLVQLVLTLFRNILAVQELTLQQKSSGFATHYLYLIDKFLEIIFEEHVMDLVLVLIQHVDDPRGFIHKDCLLLLEIFHHIFQGRDPELVARCLEKDAKADGDIATSVEYLKSIVEEEEERKRLIRQRNLERHSQFSGTFTRIAVDGSKTLIKRNPAPGENLMTVQKVPKGHLKRIAWDHGSLLFPKENILELLHNFMNHFLSGGYNALMQKIRNDVTNQHQDIGTDDIILFFQVAQFVTAFQCQKVSIMQKSNMQNSSSEAPLNGGCDDSFCGPIAATINEAMFFLVISKWQEWFEGLKITKNHKALSAAGSLMKKMIRMLDMVLKLLPEDSKEPHTARILLYKLFYDQTEHGLTQFLLNSFRNFNTHVQPKSDLADLLEIIHIVLRLMEYLQARGTLRVAKKSRKIKRTKKGSDKAGSNMKPGSDMKKNENSGLQKNVDETNEIEKTTSNAVLGDNNTGHYITDSSLDKNEETTASNQTLESDRHLNDALNEDIPHIDGAPDNNLNKQANETEDILDRHSTDALNTENIPQIDGDSENNLKEQAYETEDTSDADELPPTNEVDFNVTRLVLSFANNAVVHNLFWLLKYYKSNSSRTNHYIICMMRRFCDDLDLSPMLYQLSLLTTFNDILSDKKAASSEDFSHIIHFIKSFLRKMMKKMKSQPLLFVEILFWKTRKECHIINADALMGDIAQLKKDVRNLDDENKGMSNSGAGHKSIADSLGDDEVDNVLPHVFESQGDDKFTDEMEEDKSEGILSDFPTQRPKSRKSVVFDSEQEVTVRELYEKYKDDRHCSRNIAKALDPDGLISPLQITCKLKQMGLILTQKRSRPSRMPIPTENNADEAFDTPLPSTGQDDSHPNTSHRRKRIAFGKEQEVEIKELFERFKDEKKCSQLIANALKSDTPYTSRQISTKLRQLGLLASRTKKSSQNNPSDNIDGDETEDISDGETLLSIKERSKKRKNKVLVQEAVAAGTSQLDADNEPLSTMFKDALKKKHEPKGATTPVSNNEIEMDGVHEVEEVGMGISDQVDVKTDDVMLDLEDSDDEIGVVIPRNSGSRRNVKMVIDDDE